jgi:predicted TIM-barrel enzyme
MQKTADTIVRYYANNLSTGTAAQVGFTALADATGTAQASLLVCSNGFTTAGLIVANSARLINVIGDLLVIAGTAAKAVIVAAGGSATTDEIARFDPTTGVTVKSGKRLTLGNANTTGLSAGALAATTNASIVIYDSTGQAYRIPCII